MKLFGSTVGTELEKTIDAFADAEAKAVGRYMAMAMLARNDGNEKVAAGFEAAAHDEARHAAIYLTLNGRVPEDYVAALPKFAAGEKSAPKMMQPIVDRLRSMGLDEAAEKMEQIMADELHHGELLEGLSQENDK